MDIIEHIRRKNKFSIKTFGPLDSDRINSIIDHLKKELIEVENDPYSLEEWIDIIALALDGAHRAGYTPEEVIKCLEEKQEIVEQRKYPDWRTCDPNKAIEHIR